MSWNWADFVKSALLLLVILNPFALSVYLMEILQSQRLSTIAGLMTRAALISGIVFVLFAWGGDRVFDDVLQVRFAAFQIFGGVVFFIIAVRFMVSGGQALVVLRGPAEHLAGTIAMPFMIGPGTVSAAVVAGAKLPFPYAVLSIFVALAMTVLTLIGIKLLFDRVRTNHGRLIERYTDIASRVAAVLVGTIAVEMVLDGFQSWLHSLKII